jgi:hypothetical protein
MKKREKIRIISLYLWGKIMETPVTFSSEIIKATRHQWLKPII